MATDTRALPAFLSNDADFRTWGSGIADQLGDMGLVQTADTGQINWTTVARPAVSTVAGYEIWRFADTLQASKPVFIKLEYGIAGAADRPSIWTTVGTATNGAGTLTGQVGDRKQAAPSGSKTAGVTLNSYCSGDVNRIMLCNNLDPSATTFRCYFLVERPKDENGDDTDGPIQHHSAGAVGGTSYTQVLYSGTIHGSATSGPPVFGVTANFGSHSSVGNDLALSPFFAPYGKIRYCWPLLYETAVLTELAPISVEHLGAFHDFLPLGDGGPQHGSFGSHSWAVRWE